MLDVSDNEAAEVLLRHVGLATGRPGSFSGGADGVAETLAGVGVDVSGDRILDGSGLARGNRLRPETLLDTFTVAAGPDDTSLRPVLTGLPVAGFTGSLTFRFETGAEQGLGSVRAKTGTLSGVHGLAGTVTTDDGVVLAFVAAADKVRTPGHVGGPRQARPGRRRARRLHLRLTPDVGMPAVTPGPLSGYRYRTFGQASPRKVTAWRHAR